MIWEVCWDSLWTLSFGLSQFCGHGFWLVCEVALNDNFKGGFGKQVTQLKPLQRAVNKKQQVKTLTHALHMSNL